MLDCTDMPVLHPNAKLLSKFSLEAEFTMMNFWFERANGSTTESKSVLVAHPGIPMLHLTT